MEASTVVRTGVGTKTRRVAQRTVKGKTKKGEFDQEAFRAILRKMKGNNSVHRLSLATNLSESYLSKAMNGYVETPSRRTVMKLLQAKTSVPIDRRELCIVAGYPGLELELEAESFDKEKQLSSIVTTINQNFEGDDIVAMTELLRSLQSHGVEGNISICLYRDKGYFEITDLTTGQVYVGINAYIKPNLTETRSNQAVFSTAFSVGITFNRVAASDGASKKVVYVLTDNESIFEGCSNTLPGDRTLATVVLLTNSHLGFCQEAVLSESEHKPLSLLD